MRADAYELSTILGFERQLFAPLYQRPYVWNEEDQWAPFWNDLRPIIEKILNGNEEIKPHFMGAIVLEQIKVAIDKPDARSIIDGQQRLTTIQLFLAALRDVGNNNDVSKKVTDRIDKLIFNDDTGSEPDRFKVWPTNVDRKQFELVITAGSPVVAQNILQDNNINIQSRIFQAYLYFYKILTEWIKKYPLQIEKCIEAALNTLRKKVRIVVIDMSEEDDAQVIFETLNARGTPLLPSDLVKNFLFHKAQSSGGKVEVLYERYWKPIEEKDDFWRTPISQGRFKRPRLDLYLHHYLTLMTKKEIQVGKLFIEFQRFFEKSEKSVKWHMQSFYEHSNYYFKFMNMSDESREGIFFKRLGIMETSTLFPFLLGLYREFDKNDLSDNELLKIIIDLESFLVRRMVCQLTTKNYNNLFLDLLTYLNRKKLFTSNTVREFLLAKTSDIDRWPDDMATKEDWLSVPIYKKLRRPRLRMILNALDQNMRNSKTEFYDLRNDLTVEHLMPQQWSEHWNLPDVSKNETAEQRLGRIEFRNNHLHTIGNLTLLTESLNPAVSNSTFKRKKKEILKHSMINLNKFLHDSSSWNEQTISNRGRQLFTVIKRIWPHPS